MTASVAGVRDSPGAPLEVLNTDTILLAWIRARKCEFHPGTACPTLPLACLLFVFQHFRNVFHILHVSGDFLCCKQLFQVDVVMWKRNALAGFCHDTCPDSVSSLYSWVNAPQQPTPTAARAPPSLPFTFRYTVLLKKNIYKWIEKTSHWCFHG